MRRPRRSTTQARLARIEARLEPDPETPDFSRLPSCTIRFLRDIGKRWRDGQVITPSEAAKLQAAAEKINKQRDPAGPEGCLRDEVAAKYPHAQFPCTNCPNQAASTLDVEMTKVRGDS